MVMLNLWANDIIFWVGMIVMVLFIVQIPFLIVVVIDKYQTGSSWKKSLFFIADTLANQHKYI